MNSDTHVVRGTAMTENLGAQAQVTIAEQFAQLGGPAAGVDTDAQPVADEAEDEDGANEWCVKLGTSNT